MPTTELQVFNVAQAAKFLGVDTRVVFAMIEDGRLPAKNFTIKRRSQRRNYRIARAALEKELLTISASGQRSKRG